MKIMKRVYVVIDSTSDAMYFPLGVFLSFEEAVEALKELASQKLEGAISEHQDRWDSSFEQIKIMQREVGWSENGEEVFVCERGEVYDEDRDEYFWQVLRIQDQRPLP